MGKDQLSKSELAYMDLWPDVYAHPVIDQQPIPAKVLFLVVVGFIHRGPHVSSQIYLLLRG